MSVPTLQEMGMMSYDELFAQFKHWTPVSAALLRKQLQDHPDDALAQRIASALSDAVNGTYTPVRRLAVPLEQKKRANYTKKSVFGLDDERH